MKILLAKFGHEANTFSNGLTSYEEFIQGADWCKGDVIIKNFRGTADFLGGMIECAEKRNIELIPAVSGLISSPTLTDSCVNRIMAQLLDLVCLHLSEIDGICIGLHGAGCSESINDVESYVLTELRKIVGPDMPIMSSLDLHGNISPELAGLSNGLFGIKEYPHTDMHNAGYLAMNTLIDTVAGKVMPDIGYVHLPLLISNTAGCTMTEPMRTINAMFSGYCKEKQLIDATLFHGFPFADTPHTYASIVTIAYNGAQDAANELAEYVWNMRHYIKSVSYNPSVALDKALKVKRPGLIIINEISDSPGAGRPGDGTHLLREMLFRNLEKSIFGYLCDPHAVEQIHSHKIGDHISILLGGRKDATQGEPLWIENSEIIAMSDGNGIYVSPMNAGVKSSIGKCARLRAGNVDIIIGSSCMQTIDDRPFLATGADVNQYRYAGIKSTHHFRAFFQSITAAIIPVEVDGLRGDDFASYGYKHIRRPIFPLDQNVNWDKHSAI